MQELTASSFELASCQATVFTPDGDLSVSKAMKDFYPSFADLFDGAPVALPPLPQGVPFEIPRIILESATHEWRCELLPARASVVWQRSDSTRTPIELGEFFQKGLAVLLEYSDRLKTRVGRLAALATRFSEHDTPGLFLARHFCKDRWDKAPLNRPENFELHAHKKFTIANEFQVNSWARSKTGRLSPARNERPIVLFEQDLNTLAEEPSSKSFDKGEMERFFKSVGPELDAILKLYFPGM